MRKIILFLGSLILSKFCCFADGLDTWTKVSTTPYGAFSHIVYGNGMFAANSHVPLDGFSTITNGLSVSSDGTHWTHLPVFDYPSGLAFGNGTFAKSGWDPSTDGDAGFVYGSSNATGLTNLLLSDVFNGQYGVAYGTANYFSGITSQTNPLFVAVGHLYETDMGTIMTSTDGQHWATQNPPTSDMFLTGVAFNGSEFFTVGSLYLMPTPPTTRVLYSSDGTNWSLAPIEFSATLPKPTDIRAVRNGLYATSVTGNTTTYYTGAITWTQITPPFPSIWIPLTGTNGLYVSVNSTNGIYTSSDAANWVLRQTGITNQLTCIAFDGQNFVAGSADGSLFRSGSINPALSGQFAATNGGFKLNLTGGLAGQTYQLQASTNLTTWANVSTFTNLATADANSLDTNAAIYSHRYYRTVMQ